MAHPASRRSRKIIKSFEAKSLEKRSLMMKIADSLSSFFGSIWFLFLNTALFALWIIINLNLIPGIKPFDPYPFFMLVTIVSIEAIFLTNIVLMSQTRQNIASTIREELQLQVNLIAEKEITKTLQLIKKIAEKEGIKLTSDPDLEEMIKDTNVSYIERKLEEQITKNPTITSPVEAKLEQQTK